MAPSCSFSTDAAAIPEQLKMTPHWVVWKQETREGGKPTKVPYRADGNGKASSTNPKTWSSFDDAVRAVERGNWSGIGYVLTLDAGIAGIDLDHCRDIVTGSVAPWATEIINRISSYTEVSVSGTGVHILINGKLPTSSKHTCVPKEGGETAKIEVYDSGRYFTVSGAHLEGTPTTIEDRTEAFTELYDELFKPSTTLRGSGQRTRLDDEGLLNKARRAKNGPDFSRLYDAGDTSAYDGDDSRADLALCCHLAFWSGGDAGRIDSLFRRSALYRPKWERSDYSERTINKAIAQAKERCSPLPRSSMDGHSAFESTEEACLPVIYVSVQDLSTITDQCWDAMHAGNNPPRFFRHGNVPCRLETDDLGSPVVRELTADRARYELARVARWRSRKQIGGIPVETDAKPPLDVVKDWLATPDPPLPILTRIVEAPVFAPDGTLQTIPGYHAAARTYYAPLKGFSVPEVPLKPTSDDVARAKSIILQDLLGDFPFVVEDKDVDGQSTSVHADRANAIALLLLPFVRDLIPGPTPNHLIEAPLAGSGKSLLADVLLIPAIGRHVGVVPETHDDDELRKRITAQLREARAAIMLDNVAQPLGSGVLASALTAVNWDDRVLGKSETVSIPIRCIWVTTANNPAMTTEIARRSVRIRLDALVERPWARQGFRHPDLRGWAQENRGILVWSALTLASAWIAADRPSPKVKPLGSYEQWTTIVGGILENAGIHGFLGNLADFYEVADTESSAWRQFVEWWWVQFEDNPVGVAELYGAAIANDYFDLGKGGERSQRITFGIMLSKQRGRTIGEYRIVQDRKKDRGVTRWVLQMAGSQHEAT